MDREQVFRLSIENDLKMRGYTDIEIIGSCASIKRGTAYGVKNGVKHKLRIIVPDNHTIYRSRHFRVTEVYE